MTKTYYRNRRPEFWYHERGPYASFVRDADGSIPMRKFSDYIVYVDESGDHGLNSINPQYPVFSLVFCVISKIDYANQVVPAVQEFKFRYWGMT